MVCGGEHKPTSHFTVRSHWPEYDSMNLREMCKSTKNMNGIFQSEVEQRPLQSHGQPPLGVWSDNLDLPLLMMSRGQSALPAIAGIEIVKPTASHGEAQGVARSTSRPTST